jgi:hypothetical protein
MVVDSDALVRGVTRWTPRQANYTGAEEEEEEFST